MGKFLSVYFAFAAISMNVHIFRENQVTGPGPLISTYIFLFAFVLLLWDLTLYPKSLRTLGTITQFAIEFLIATFLTESIMIDFWFPLETVAMDILPKSADFIDDMLNTGEWRCESLCEVLRGQALGYLVSYLLSMSFLLSVLHATRVIDLRALGEGPSCFFADISFRFKKFWRKFWRRLGFGNKNGSSEILGDTDDNDDEPSDSRRSIITFSQKNKTRVKKTGRRGKRETYVKRKASVSRDRSRRGSRATCSCPPTNDPPVYSKFSCNIL
ncbi:uncharacterized protein [Leptinotarsa decemlineata]|uniref:uncharacterized protein n=1 Tax=Leptinotarsa decemlineata TaxID=7539 RepID=UPI003D308AFD